MLAVLVALLAVIDGILAQPQTKPVPGTTPSPSYVDPCLVHDSCTTCVVDDRCLWCLSATSHPCRSRSFCPLTGYSDCCVLYKSCPTCKANPSCGFCADTSLCIPGNSTTPKGTTCHSWHYDSCPIPGKGPPLSIVLVIMLTLGCGVVLLSLVLLVLFCRRIMRQNRARRDMNEYYQPSRAVCDFCQDVLATVFCKECKLHLCDYCVLSDDLHPRGTNHTFEPIEHDIQDENAAQPLRKEDAYTSFAGLLSKSSSTRSYDSYGSRH